MSKEKVFGLIKKKKEEREKEVTKKCIIFSLMTFALMGFLFFHDLIMGLEVNFINNFWLKGLFLWSFFMLNIFTIIFTIWLVAQLSTKKYKLKEIKK